MSYRMTPISYAFRFAYWLTFPLLLIGVLITQVGTLLAWINCALHDLGLPRWRPTRRRGPNE